MKVPAAIEDAGHVLIGLIPGWGIVREWRQLPPENDLYPAVWVSRERKRAGGEYWAKPRVMDLMRDLAGYAVGDAIRTAILVGLLIWRW